MKMPGSLKMGDWVFPTDDASSGFRVLSEPEIDPGTGKVVFRAEFADRTAFTCRISGMIPVNAMSTSGSW